MKKLKYVKLFENFSEIGIKEGAYLVSGKELESMGIDAYRFVGRIDIEDDVINFMISPRNELTIAIYVGCQNPQDLVNNFKKYPNKEVSGVSILAGRSCNGSIVVNYSGEIQLRHGDLYKDALTDLYPGKYAGLIVDILKKWSEQTGQQDMGIRIGSKFHNLSEISILEAEKLMKTELERVAIQ